MKERTKKKIFVCAFIFVIGTISSIAVMKLAGDNGYLRQLILVAPTALAGFVISSKESDSLLPNSFRTWVGFIVAVLFVTTLFWALEHYALT